MQPVDTAVNQKFKARVREQQETWELQQLVASPDSVPKISRKVLLERVDNAWKHVKCDVDAEKVFRQAGITLPLDGSADGDLSCDLIPYWEEAGMRGNAPRLSVSGCSGGWAGRGSNRPLRIGFAR